MKSPTRIDRWAPSVHPKGQRTKCQEIKVRLFNKGSEWRKWDLHIHAPGTKTNDLYEKVTGQPDTDRFCELLHDSDVHAFGITDYFSFSTFFEVKSRYEHLYPTSEKVLFPNLELRLNETVDKNNDHVNLHLIFRPDLTRTKAELFLSRLETELLDGSRKRNCSELNSSADWTSAMVSRDAIDKAIKAVFGPGPRLENLLVVAAAGNSGITTNSAKPRTLTLARAMDELCDGVFGNSRNVERYLDIDRWADASGGSRQIPVFGGCDAHSFQDLDERLGKDIDEQRARSEITWVKADLTFEGLQQTVFEPTERIALAPSQPDFKEPFKWIDRITFTGTGDFPAEVQFNPNLNSIIGSRSSGKSALLAYIAHAVDPDHTEVQQVAAGADPKTLGPAAGKTWKSVESIHCEVHWASPEASDGKIVYIPQNALFTLSDNYEEITAKIRPAVFLHDPAFGEFFRNVEGQIDQKNLEIRTATEEWLSEFASLRTQRDALRELGDKASVTSTRDQLIVDITAIRQRSSLSDEEVEKYQAYVDAVATRAIELEEINASLTQFAPYVDRLADGTFSIRADAVQVRFEVVPRVEDVPEDLAIEIRQTLDENVALARAAVEGALLAKWNVLTAREEEINATDKLEATANEMLIAKNQSNKELEDLVARHSSLEKQLSSIEKQELKVAKSQKSLEEIGSKVEALLDLRTFLLSSLKDKFDSSQRSFDDL